MTTRLADRTTELIRASYEAVPYEGIPLPYSHPDTLSTMVRLRGLTAAPLDDCKVLELGCGMGDNLIPMALSLPGSQCLGVDLSPSQVDFARHIARTLGLRNARFEVASIADLGDDLGMFDYIICHGVYSWVPPNVQDAILRVCKRNLAPRGVAYVSYNTYPGWHFRGLARDMIRFHDDPALPPAQRAARGRELVEFFQRSSSRGRPVLAAVLEAELRILTSTGDSYFLHEELEDVNEPIYFTEFVRRATQHGLRYASDAEPALWRAVMAPEVREKIMEWSSDEIRLEQYVDFVDNSPFRCTLLCHRDIELTSEPKTDAVMSCWITSSSAPAEPVAADAKLPDGARTFRTRGGMRITLAEPIGLAALDVLHEADPDWMAFDELCERVASRLGRASRDLRDTLAEAMHYCALVRLVEPHSQPQPFARAIDERPVATPLARFQAARSEIVTNLRHVSVLLQPIERFLIQHVDGTRDAAALLDVLRTGVSERRLELPPDVSSNEHGLEYVLDRSLDALRRFALLMP